MIAAIGLTGTEEDCHRFMELMIADFNRRCNQANSIYFEDRLTLLPVEETLPSGEVH